MKKRVAIYIRVSSEEQAKEGYSISAQRQKLMQYCDLQDWELIDMYVDEGWSGAKIDRPELSRLREDMERGLFDLVLVWRVDRFFRNVYFLATVLHEMEKRKVSFVSMTESFDTSHPSGKAMLQMLAIFAEWERETIRERIKNALSERARQGLHHAQVPFGYLRDPKTKVLYPDEEKAKAVVRAFQLRVKGYSQGEIAKDLISKWGYSFFGIEEDHETGVLWFVQRILENPVYRGSVVYQGKEVPGKHDGIVDEETYAMVQKLRGERHDAKYFYIFKGLFYCGQCGSKMRCRVLKRPDKLQTVYFCPNTPVNYTPTKKKKLCNGRKIYEHVALRQMKELLRDTLLNIDETNIEQEIVQNDTSGMEERLIELDHKIVDLRKRKNRYFVMFEEDPDFEEQAKERIKEITRQIQSFEHEKAEMEEAINQVAVTHEVDLDSLKLVVKHLDTLIENSNREEIRDLFLSLFDKIIVERVPDSEYTPGRPGSVLTPVWAQDTL